MGKALPAGVSDPSSLPEGSSQPMKVPMDGLAAREVETASQPSCKPQSRDRMAVTASQAIAPYYGILARDSSKSRTVF